MDRILIAGTGALGSLYGAFLRHAGHRVTLLGRAAHLEAIHDRGLAVEASSERRRSADSSSRPASRTSVVRST
jgi:2-dehydropantoate 2-reductase